VIHPPASAGTAGPFGADDIVADLRRLGLRPGDIVMVHVSLSSLGWVIGGGVALLQALLRTVGTTGCIVVPTFTTYLTDPALWVNRAVPPQWHGRIRSSLPGFQPDLHGTQPGIGRFAEVVRTASAAVRSVHPIYSFAALGAGARPLLADSPRDWALGSRGPLGRFADSGGRVLAIGIPWWSKCTTFHLAEHLADYPGRMMYTLPGRVATPAGDNWIHTHQLVFHDGDFPDLGRDLAGLAISGSVGTAAAAVLDAPTVAAAATSWLLAHRDLRGAKFPRPYADARPAPAGQL
jgi:aminoglycoside 3-N-acetyltransferase